MLSSEAYGIMHGIESLYSKEKPLPVFSPRKYPLASDNLSKPYDVSKYNELNHSHDGESYNYCDITGHHCHHHDNGNYSTIINTNFDKYIQSQIEFQKLANNNYIDYYNNNSSREYIYMPEDPKIFNNSNTMLPGDFLSYSIMKDNEHKNHMALQYSYIKPY